MHSIKFSALVYDYLLLIKCVGHTVGQYKCVTLTTMLQINKDYSFVVVNVVGWIVTELYVVI
jgi:hypothetical protein